VRFVWAGQEDSRIKRYSNTYGINQNGVRGVWGKRHRQSYPTRRRVLTVPLDKLWSTGRKRNWSECAREKIRRLKLEIVSHRSQLKVRGETWRKEGGRERREKRVRSNSGKREIHNRRKCILLLQTNSII